jgi:HSP20 family protein
MAIVRWEPFNNLFRLQDRINRMFEEAFDGTSRLEGEPSTCDWKPSVDIYEDEAGTVVMVDLPGVPKDQITLEIKNDMLTVSGQRPDEALVSSEYYVRRERGCGTFRRSFRMQTALDPALVTARFKDGVLEIRIPRPDSETVRKIPIAID